MIKKFAEAFKPLNENVKHVNEAKNPDIIIPANDAYDLEEEADNFKSILKKAGVDTKCKAGFGEVEVYLKDKGDMKKAQKAIQKAGYVTEAETLTEAKVELDSANFEDKAFQAYLKKNGIKAKLVDAAGPGGYNPVYKYTADKNTLKKLIDMFWAVDAGDAEEREEWYSLIESKGFASRELIKATDKLHAEQLKLQDLQSKFVTETDPAKKEKFKKQVIDQHKIVKQVERDFQTTLGREEEDIDDMFESNIGALTGIEGALSDLEAELADGGIDDILTDIESAADEMPLTSASDRELKKRLSEIFTTYAKFCVAVGNAIAATKK